MNEVKSGLCDGKAKPEIIKQTPATAFVNGNNGIGFVSALGLRGGGDGGGGGGGGRFKGTYSTI